MVFQSNHGTHKMHSTLKKSCSLQTAAGSDAQGHKDRASPRDRSRHGRDSGEGERKKKDGHVSTSAEANTVDPRTVHRKIEYRYMEYNCGDKHFRRGVTRCGYTGPRRHGERHSTDKMALKEHKRDAGGEDVLAPGGHGIIAWFEGVHAHDRAYAFPLVFNWLGWACV